MIAVLLMLVGCSEPGPPVYPEMGYWEGPGIVWQGTGVLPVDYPYDDLIEYRAPLTWPDGEGTVYRTQFSGTGGGPDGPWQDLELEVTEEAVVARIRPWGVNELPFNITMCGEESCAREWAGEQRQYEPGQGPRFVYNSGAAEQLFVFPDPPVLAVGERRPFQAMPMVEYPLGNWQENTGPNGLPHLVSARDTVTCSTEDPGIATVDDRGVLVGVAPGATTLTMTAGAVSETVEVTVTDEALELADAQGVYDIGPVGISINRDSGSSRVTLDEDGMPTALLRSLTTQASNPPLWLSNNTAVLSEWTGTGFGYERLTQDNLDDARQTALVVDDTGRRWLPSVHTRFGFRASVYHRPADSMDWQRTYLPVRPFLDRGEGVDESLMGYPEVNRVIVNLGARPSSRGGLWVGYQFIYFIPLVPTYTTEVWQADGTTNECYRIVRLAHVDPDGTVEVQDAKRTDIARGACDVTGLSPDDYVDPAADVVVGEEDPVTGVPSLTVFEGAERGAFVPVHLRQEGDAWVEYTPEPNPYGYDPSLTIGDPYGPVQGVEATNDRSWDVYTESWKDDRYVMLSRSWFDGPLELDERMTVIVWEGLRLRHDDSDAEGRRIGTEARTPRSSTEALVSDGCRMVMNNADTFANGGATHIAAGPDTVWEAATPSVNINRFPFEAERLLARPDGIYAFAGSSFERSTNCEDFFPLAQLPEPLSGYTLPLLRDDGSVWVFAPEDGFGGSIAVWDDPLLSPVGWEASSDLVEPDYVSPSRLAGIRDGGDRVLTFFKFGTDLAITEYDATGQILDSRIVAQPPPHQRRLYTNQMQQLDGGDWLGTRRLGGSNDPSEIVRTSDFSTYTVLANDITCAGVGTLEAYAERSCASLKLSDGRIAFAHQVDGPLPNQRSAAVRLYDADGNGFEDVLLRPGGGMTQGVHSLYEEADGSLTAFMYDSHTYAQPAPGHIERYTDLVQNVVLP